MCSSRETFLLVRESEHLLMLHSAHCATQRVKNSADPVKSSVGAFNIGWVCAWMKALLLICPLLVGFSVEVEAEAVPEPPKEMTVFDALKEVRCHRHCHQCCVADFV